MSGHEPTQATLNGRSGAVGVSLRRAQPSDAARILAWRREPSATRYQPLQPRELASMETELTARAVPAIGPELTGKVQWIVHAADEPAGWITLTVTSRDHATGSIGYTIGERYRRRGYARAAVRAVVSLAFAADGVDLDRLEAVAAVANGGSRKVLEQSGFQLEGIARELLVIHGERVDHACYTLLRSAWRANASTPEQFE